MKHSFDDALRSCAGTLYLFGVCIAAVACGGPGSSAEQRALANARTSGPIDVAAVWPWQARKELLYRQGLDLAVDEINAAGGVHGRPLRVLREDDGESVNEGRLVAGRLARNSNIVAVIGHLQSYVTVPAAGIYDMAGMVLLSPAATDAVLTAQGYPRVFRAIFTDREAGAQMADYAALHGYRRIAIYYVRTDYGRALANAFEERASEHGLTIVSRHSHDAGQQLGDDSLDPLLDEWKQLGLDAMFLAGEVPLAGELIAAIRHAGIKTPILGGDAMSSPALIDAGGRDTEGTVVAASFHPEQPTVEARRFTAAFRRRYGVDPDPSSALGYDAVRLLATAMLRARTITPDEIARELHALRQWPGVTGPFTFDASGNLVGRHVLEVMVRNGHFQYVPTAAVAEVSTPAAR
jgi:branched-chain amino acid transport system substrate-binding protein